ncbi:hypothetical protein MYSI104531_26340 [Mycobacterium simiae]
MMAVFGLTRFPARIPTRPTTRRWIHRLSLMRMTTRLRRWIDFRRVSQTTLLRLLIVGRVSTPVWCRMGV